MKRPPPKLYIFPHLGGAVNFYVPFSKAFSTGMKRVAVQYPARRNRQNIPILTSIPALVDDICNMLMPSNDADGQIAFFGHSMGGLVAFEVARKFESAGTPIAVLFVSACAAPGHVGYDYLQGSDRDLVNLVVQLTGTNPEFLDNPDFFATITPTLRTARAIAGYTCPPGTTVSCPIYAFLGDEDEIATYEKVAPWCGYTTSEFAARVFPGDHFYLNQNLPELVKDVEARMAHWCGCG